MLTYRYESSCSSLSCSQCEVLAVFVQVGIGTRHSGDCVTRLPGAGTLAREVLLRPRSASEPFGRLTPFTSSDESAMGHGDGKDEWYCTSCSDYWRGHYLDRSHRAACFKCQLPKGQCFFGKVERTGSPMHRVVQRAHPDAGIQKEIAKLQAENTRLKQAAGKADAAPAEAGEDELEKLVAKTMSVRSLVKSIPELGDALAALDARLAELRADRLKAKPGSERLRQLETETKRKQVELASVQSKRAAAQNALRRSRLLLLSSTRTEWRSRPPSPSFKSQGQHLRRSSGQYQSQCNMKRGTRQPRTTKKSSTHWQNRRYWTTG